MTSGARTYPYTPETPTPPGESLKEHLDHQGISQADLSRRTGLSTKHINQIIQGSAVLSPSTAVLLERATGLSAAMWSRLEAAWQTHQSQRQDLEKLSTQTAWVMNFPLAYLKQRKVLADTRASVENIQRLLAFFEVASPDVAQQAWREYRTAFRRSELVDGDEYAVATWLRFCERDAREQQCQPYRREDLIAALPRMRALTVKDPEFWLTELPRLCASVGISLVFAPALKNTHLSGATRWLAPDKAMIALSDRFKTDDTFWFSFFHEIGHLLLHGKRLTFLDSKPADDADESEDDTQQTIGPVLLHGTSATTNATEPSEQEADSFAGDLLIPAEYLPAYARLKKNPSLDKVKEFSRQIGVAPGIPLGRLQHEGAIPWPWGRDLKRVIRFSHAEKHA